MNKDKMMSQTFRGDNCLHVFLFGKWWDMIKAHQKREEYRRNCAFWSKRILKWRQSNGTKYIVMHRGYTSRILVYESKRAVVDMGNIMWGAPSDEAVWCLELSRMIYESN